MLNFIATAKYTHIPTAVAKIVPFGIDFFGSFKSPDNPSPAAKPVNAGKIIANTTQKFSPSLT